MPDLDLIKQGKQDRCRRFGKADPARPSWPRLVTELHNSGLFAGNAGFGDRMMGEHVLVKNAWYVAGLSQEFPPQRLHGQAIAEKPLVLWRGCFCGPTALCAGHARS